MTEITRHTIDTRIEELIAQATAHAMPDSQAENIVRLVNTQALASSRGGKRLRALLTLATYRAAGGKPEKEQHALDVACAIEVFQTAALIHDDIIDDSDLRRGAPSAHKALGDALNSPARGNGLGIMLGDLMATLSVDIVVKAAEETPRSHDIIQTFLRMHRDVEIGQVMDVALETITLENAQALKESALDTYQWKTASYTTIAPINLGMLCAGTNPEIARQTAWKIGLPLGIAFQINDDLLDVDSDTRTTGKPVGGDIKEGKRTLLMADALTMSTPDDRATLIHAYENPTEERDVTTITRIMRQSGAISESRRHIARLWNETHNALTQSQDTFPTPKAREELVEQCRAFLPDAPR